tara:strand:- start:368 stop:1096 length:729 start_codon:yes stop_codon:yes gene_type:complete
MADEKKFALPDSMQFRAFYAQKRRRSRNSNVVPITKNFINLLGDPPQAYYELDTPWVASGDFEIEVDFSTTSLDLMYLANNTSAGSNYLRISGGQLRLRLNDGSTSTTVSSTTGYDDGILHNVVCGVKGGVQFMTVDGIVEAEVTNNTPNPNTNFNIIGTSANSAYFQGIISDVKLTDITAPANSLSFGLDNLTGDTEVNNGVTLNYRNIAETSDVRDTYTLSNNDTQWISDLRTIDIAEQA